MPSISAGFGYNDVGTISAIPGTDGESWSWMIGLQLVAWVLVGARPTRAKRRLPMSCGRRYALRGRDAPPHECKSDHSPLSYQRLLLAYYFILRDQAEMQELPDIAALLAEGGSDREQTAAANGTTG